MNTTERGNKFEDKVFNYLQEELKNERLLVSSKTSSIHKKKGYYSKDRDSNIITDISIEVRLPESLDFSLLLLVECKDYGKEIPVDDIEEFHSKIQQVAGANVKAIFATTSALQKGAYKFAHSKKIGVIRFLPGEQVKWIINNSLLSFDYNDHKLNQKEFTNALFKQNHFARNRAFYGWDSDHIYGNLEVMLKHYLNDEDEFI